MLNINKGFLALSTLTAFSLSAMENKIVLVHKNNDFSVETEGSVFPIQRCYMDKELRGISPETLAKYAAAGARLDLNKLTGNDHEYTLKLKGRLNGGGPITANILYWTVKGLGYGVPAGIAVTTAGAAIAPLIPAVAAPVATAVTTGTFGAAATAGAASGTAAAAGVASCALTASAGPAVAAGMVAGEVAVAAVGANAAATATAGVLGAGSTTGAYVAAVESASGAAFVAGMACWFLP